MFKRVSSVVMVIAMLLTMLCTFSVASAAAPMSLEITAKNNQLEYKRGDTVTLTVTMKDYSAACALAIVGEYDADVLTDPKSVKGELGAPAGFNKTTLYCNWANAENFEVLDDDFEPISDFALVTFRFTVAADAEFGETTVKIAFAQQDANGSDKTNTYLNGSGVNTVMVPGTDYVAEAATITLNIKCPTDHDALTWTSDDNGKHVKACPDCEYEISEDCTLVDDPASSSTATCQKDGSVVKKCEKDCGYSVEQQNGKLDHVWGEYTSNNDGTHEAICITCDPDVATPAVDTKDCEYDVYTEADCENAGTKKCDVCGFVTEDESAPATEHAWGDWANVEGTEQHARECANDNCPVGTEVEDCVCDSNYFDPTCDENGYTVRICHKCLEEYVEEDLSEEGAATGHKFEGFVHNEDEDGNHTHSSNGACLNGCGTTIVNEECDFDIDYPTCVDDGEMTCAVCNYNEPIPAGGFHANMVTVYKPTTAEEGGYFWDYCTDCGEPDWKFYETEAGEPFKDISSDEIGEIWFVGPANFCYTYGGLMIGEYGNFNAGSAITRGQVVTVLGRLWLAQYGQYFTEEEYVMYELGEEWLKGLTDEEFDAFVATVAEAYEVEPVTLNDLNGAYFDRYALLLANMGVVKGRDDGSFDGWATVTRAELATFLVRYLDANGWRNDFEDIGSEFSDLASCGWATEYVEYAGEIGLFAGDENGKFNPWAKANRGQLATLLERLVRATEFYEIVDEIPVVD